MIRGADCSLHRRLRHWSVGFSELAFGDLVLCWLQRRLDSGVPRTASRTLPSSGLCSLLGGLCFHFTSPCPVAEMAPFFLCGCPGQNEPWTGHRQTSFTCKHEHASPCTFIWSFLSRAAKRNPTTHGHQQLQFYTFSTSQPQSQDPLSSQSAGI